MARSAFSRCVNMLLDQTYKIQLVLLARLIHREHQTVREQPFDALQLLYVSYKREIQVLVEREREEVKSTVNSTDGKLRVLNSFTCISMTINVFSIN